MEYNPDEEPTRQIRYRPESDPNQQTSNPAGDVSPQGADDTPANTPGHSPGAASEEEPTLRLTPQTPRTPPQQAAYPSQAERYSPVPPGSYLPPQPESYSPPSASSSSPTLPNYPPPGQGNYPPAPPGAYQAQQPIYPPSRQDYSAEPSSAPYPTPTQRPPMPMADKSSANQYSQYVYPPHAPAAPAQQTRGNGYTTPAAQGARDAAGARSTFNAQQFWRDLALLGQVSSIAGLIILIFFFLPWLYTPDFSANLSGKTTIPTVGHSGWRAASGVQLFSNVPAVNLFPHLWLVLLCALALIALGVMLGLHRIRVRTAALLISLISLGALLMEFFFLIQVTSLGSAIRIGLSSISNQTLYGASWGFWLTVVATIATLGVGVYMVLEAFAPDTLRRPRAPGMPGGPGQYPTPTA